VGVAALYPWLGVLPATSVGGALAEAVSSVPSRRTTWTAPARLLACSSAVSRGT
jgi:hypothetical protein